MKQRSIPLRGRVTAGALAGVVALSLAACSSTSSSSSSSSAPSGSSAATGSGHFPATIPVAYVGDQTGAAGYVGVQLLEGMQLRINELDASHFFGSSTIQLTVKDTQSNQQNAISLMNQVASSNALAVVGPLLSNEGLATEPIAARAGLPYLEAVNEDEQVLTMGNNIYRTTVSQLQYNPLTIPYLQKNGVKSVAMVYDSDNPTLVQVGTQQYPGLLKQANMSLVSSDGIPIADTNVASLASKIAGENPGAVGLMVIGPQNPDLITALRNDGYKGIIFGETAMQAGALKPAGALANGVVYPMDYTPSLTYPTSQAFTKAFEAAYPGTTPNAYDAEGYDTMTFLANAIKDAPAVTRAGLLKGMAAVAAKGFSGAVGPLKWFGPGNKNVSTPGVLVKWENGQETIAALG